MATLGPNDLKNVSLPTKWDAAELSRLTLRDGTTYAQMIADINDALGMVNGALQNTWLSNLISTTSDATVEYGIGTTGGYEDMTEYSQPDAKRAATGGHMLPIKNYDRKLGWTQLFLEEARRTQLDADIASAAQDTLNIWEQKVLDRLFNATATTGVQNGVGANGSSVPFADAGTADSGYVPMARADRGGTFASNHTHYLRLDGITQANVETAVGHLWEHGHDAPYTIIASNADAAAWNNATNLTGLVKATVPGVIPSSTTAVASGLPDGAIAVITTNRGPAYVYLSGRIPTKYWGALKSYGRMDARNPLRVRYDERFGLGAKLEVQDISLYPLRGAIARVKFGVGVGADRTSAVLVENDSSGSYDSPTIS